MADTPDPRDGLPADADAPGRAPGMADVARAAGVSMQTVSRVLNDSPHVAEPTRSRVLSAVAELGYRPNLAARALATGRSDTVGVLAPSSGLYGPSSIVAALGSAVAARRMHLSVEHLPSFDTDTVRAAVDRLDDQRVAGIVVLTPEHSAHTALRNTKAGVPMVTVDGPGSPGSSSVSVDQELGGRLATTHLLQRGHDTVWHVAGPPEWNDASARERGWRSTLDQAGREVPTVLRGDWSAASGHDAGRRLARIPECTAVFAANDAIALGVINALVQQGRRVPQDVSVVGFDDIPEAGYFLPPLTTVRQEFAELGRAALDVLLDQLTGSRPAGEHLVAPTLIERSSVTRPS